MTWQVAVPLAVWVLSRLAVAAVVLWTLHILAEEG